MQTVLTSAVSTQAATGRAHQPTTRAPIK